MTVQEETETETATMPSQNKEDNNAQIDVEVGIDGDAADLSNGAEKEAASTTAGSEASTKVGRTQERDGMSKIMINKMATSDDPFAIREGKTLLWTNVNMVLVSA
jgi:hypothetical protein